MYKKLLILFLLPAFLFPAEPITKNYRFDKPLVIDGVARLKGCITIPQCFVPSVPVRPVQLLLPQGCEAEDIEIYYGEKVLFPETHYLNPVIPPVIKNNSTTPTPFDQIALKSPVYSANSDFPGVTRSGQKFVTQYKNGHAILVTWLNPVQYNPVSREISYFKDISIRVNLTSHKRVSSMPYICTPSIKAQLLNIVDNPEQITGIPYTQKDADDYEYLIITELGTLPQETWQPFIDFNRERGLRTKIVTTGYIYNNVEEGIDNTEKVRIFIKQEYTEHKIVYVMLGGDVNIVPHREFECHFYDHADQLKYTHSRNIACDFYFSGLDNTWKSPNGQYTDDHDSWNWTWGCPGYCDFYPDVFAARFPAGSKAELTTIINKTIAYSNNPVEDELNNILLTGEFLWAMAGGSVWGGDHCEQMINTCDEHYGPTYGWPLDIGPEEYHCTFTKLYDEKPQTNSWGSSDCIRAVNESKCSWFVYHGHGNTNSNAKITSSQVTASTFYNSDGKAANYFIIFTSGCYPGQYEGSSDCILEYFLVKQENGAVATIGNAHTGLLDDNSTDGFQQRPYRYIIDNLYNPQYRTHHLDVMYGFATQRCAPLMLGSSIHGAHYNGGMRFVLYSCDLLGDPALSVWTRKPVTWSDLPNCSATNTKFTLTGIPPYTWVALVNSDNDSIITTQLTGFSHNADSSVFNVSDSNCAIDDEPYKAYAQSHTDVKVIVKAHNYYNYSKTVPITSTPVAYENKKIASLTTVFASGDRVKIIYNLPESEFISISVYDSKGALIETLAHNKQAKGFHSLSFKTEILNNGIYYCRLQTGKHQHVKKLLVTK